MQMIGKKNHRLDFEGPGVSAFRDRIMQDFARDIGREYGCAIFGDDREEVHAAAHVDTTKIGHGRIVTKQRVGRE